MDLSILCDDYNKTGLPYIYAERPVRVLIEALFLGVRNPISRGHVPFTHKAGQNDHGDDIRRG